MGETVCSKEDGPICLSALFPQKLTHATQRVLLTRNSHPLAMHGDHWSGQKHLLRIPEAFTLLSLAPRWEISLPTTDRSLSFYLFS